jgi:hypothetical protein
MKGLQKANWLLALGLGASIIASGCNKTPTTESSTTPPPESTPAAVTDPPSAEPQSAPPDAAAKAAPPAPAPAAQVPPRPAAPPTPPPPPPPPPPKVYTIASGTAFAVSISQTLSGKKSSVGDPFSGTLAQSIRVGDVTVIKSGTPVNGTVVAAKGQGKFKGEGDLGIQVSQLGPYRVTTTPYEASVKGKGKRSGAMIGGGAGGGALIGGLAGGGKGALIGGLVGAGAGTAGAAMTGGKDVTIPAESVVNFTLTSPITVTIKPKAAAE